MEDNIIEVVAKAAGIGGIAIGTLLLLFKEFIRKNIFPKLTKNQAYNLLKLFLLANIEYRCSRNSRVDYYAG